MPDDFSQEYEEQEIQLRIDVDAIQINNFIPDYENDKPWGDVEIQDCIQEGPYEIQSLVTENPKFFEVQYDKGSKSLMKNEEDFFQNIPVLFPGDVYTDTLHLANKSNNPIKLYFHTYSEESELLSKIGLKIVLKSETNEKLIYDGNLNSKMLEEEILLTEISRNGEQQLVYTIDVPKELDNQYTLLKDKVRWMFSVEEMVKSTPPVATGDSMTGVITLFTMVISGSALVILVFQKKRSKKIVDKNHSGIS